MHNSFFFFHEFLEKKTGSNCWGQMNDDEFEKILNDVKENRAKMIGLARWVARDERLWELFGALKDNTTVHEVRLCFSTCSVVTMNALTDSIRHNPNSAMTSLVLTGCRGLQLESIHLLAQTIACSSCRISVLSLDDCGLSIDAYACVTEALQQNSSLRTLYLGRNSLASVECGLWNALKFNTSLSYLDLYGSNITSSLEMAESMSESLKLNKGLTCLSMPSCHMTHLMAQGIADTLRSNNNTTLRRLMLQENEFSSAGLVALGQALCFNHTLTELDVSGCNHHCVWDANVARAWSKALMWNRHLQSLRAGYAGRGVSPEGRERMQCLLQALVLNNTLTRWEVWVAMRNVKKEEMQKALWGNGSLLHCSFGGRDEEMTELCARNTQMHQTTKRVALLMIAIRKLRKSHMNVLPKEIVKMLASDIWNTRADVDAWSNR